VLQRQLEQEAAQLAGLPDAEGVHQQAAGSCVKGGLNSGSGSQRPHLRRCPPAEARPPPDTVERSQHPVQRLLQLGSIAAGHTIEPGSMLAVLALALPVVLRVAGGPVPRRTPWVRSRSSTIGVRWQLARSMRTDAVRRASIHPP